MRNLKNISFFLFMVSCTGTDIVDDLVEPKIVVDNALESLAVGESYQFNVKYFNNLGIESTAVVQWSSSDPTVISIDDTGLASANLIGTVDITAQTDNAITVFSLDASNQTVQVSGERMTELNTVSSYELSGTATLRKENGKLILSFSDNFNADTGLPGLFVYLSNSTNTINNALEVAPITKFTGAQSFDITETSDLFEYNIVLFYCKPFLVSVGNGTLNP